jgi:hypothetical protein
METMTFRNFLLEQESEQQAQQLQAKVKELSQPQTVQRMIQMVGAKNLDDLIAKLRVNPKVQAVIQQYQQLKVNEAYSEGMMGTIFGGIWKALTGVFRWALSSIGKTIAHVFAPFGDSSEGVGAKMEYASMLLLTFGLSGTLLAAGAPVAVAAAAMPFTATMWGLMWFGKNFLEPVLKMTDG